MRNDNCVSFKKFSFATIDKTVQIERREHNSGPNKGIPFQFCLYNVKYRNRL
jgi:hypothetical protein